MSEPLSATEIEDVLSSIRRLVSDDLRPVGRTGQAVQNNAEKLILTPAFRVVQHTKPSTHMHLIGAQDRQADDMADVEADAAVPMFIAVPRSNLSDPAPRFSPEAPSVSRIGQVVAHVAAAVAAQPGDWEAEAGDDAPATDLDFAAMDWDIDDEAPMAANMYADDLIFAQPTADAPAVMSAVAAEDVPGWAQDVAEPAADAVQPAPDIGLDQSEQAAAVVPDAGQVLRGSLEPDPVWADAAEASVIAALASDTGADNAAQSGFDPDLGDTAVRFDEEVLRELVQDILREELAGRIGERITRNIRKLVRAEIARALATQDFD